MCRKGRAFLPIIIIFITSITLIWITIITLSADAESVQSTSAIENTTSDGVPLFTWGVDYGTVNSFDLINSIQQTTDSGFIAGGYIAMVGGTDNRAWVLKLNDLGEIQWQHGYDGELNGRIYSIRQTPDGGYIAAGSYANVAIPWLLKLDEHGNIEWQKNYSGTGAFSALELTEGGYIATGFTHSYGGGDHSILVMKFDSEGEIIWSKAYGGGGDEDAYAIQETHNNDYIIAGTNDIGLLYVLQVSGTSGEISWQKNYSTDFNWVLKNKAIHVTTEGDILVIGTGGDTQSNYDLWMLKLNSSGDVIWSNSYGGLGQDNHGTILETTDGNYIFSGDTSSFGLSDGEIWLVKLNPDGNIIWNKVLDLPNWDRLVQLALANDGGYVVTSLFSNPLSDDPDNNDLRILKIDSNGDIPDSHLTIEISATPTGITSIELLINEPIYLAAPEIVTTNVSIYTPTISNTNRFAFNANGFLELPISYTTSFDVAALGNSGPPDRKVNSWYDHQYPTYEDDEDALLLGWDGVYQDDDGPTCNFGENCYDGHNGIDFQYNHSGNEPVYAAAKGEVEYIFNEWPSICDSRGCGYGNYVLIRHDSDYPCYATLYAHLEQITVTENSTVQQGDPIGIMGGTGGWPIHLHFGLYKDCSSNPTWPENSAVDPYGFLVNEVPQDPAFSNRSFPRSVYLWKHRLSSTQIVSDTGGQLASPSGSINVTIPPNALVTETKLSLWQTMPRSQPQNGYSSLGYAFRLDALSSNIYNLQSNQSSINLSFNQPVSITVNYQDTEALLVFEEDIVMYLWDDNLQTWVALPTIIIPSLNAITAVTMETGQFDIQAPKRYQIFIPIIQK